MTSPPDGVAIIDAGTTSGLAATDGEPTGVARPNGDHRCGHDLVERFDPSSDFNFRHFRMRHMAAELLRTYSWDGIGLGAGSPHFELETTDGRRLHLRDLRGRPVLLHFVSYTCPVTRGAAASMRELHRRYGDQVQFVDVVVRQAHPGEREAPFVRRELGRSSLPT